ncbi:peptide-methionine (R)-S-oxide reductase [Wenyingzhuangia heitensis]|uniref:peptide-methionine (R)-S-oxide reductase n=1 Tax=Wenyingzhuangia heitensis TaxID=1487859 RepID=A0ABX0UC00_9FLAO|nr:peptide-methionine (R)-S-oxide reductase MsrB [Wenyingzhuangia heitensis]NIJ46354.1 peptide-methionine (R)-S-oxide reductase [Wenyingzhuangia heitensis]
MLTWKDIIHFTVKGNPIPTKRVEKSAEEWKEILTPKQFQITRLSGTEMPHTGAYCTSHQAGIYNCVCCGNELFDSSIKFESGTGWPSFTQPVRNNAIKYIKDETHGMVRVEVQCNNCDSHLGHIFPDGPEPTGLRYCINSESLIKK